MKHKPSDNVPGQSVAVANKADENHSICNIPPNVDIGRHARRPDEGSSSGKHNRFDRRALSATLQESKRKRKVHVDMPLERHLQIDVVHHMETMTTSMWQMAEVVKNQQTSKQGTNQPNTAQEIQEIVRHEIREALQQVISPV